MCASSERRKKNRKTIIGKGKETVHPIYFCVICIIVGPESRGSACVNSTKSRAEALSEAQSRYLPAVVAKETRSGTRREK